MYEYQGRKFIQMEVKNNRFGGYTLANDVTYDGFSVRNRTIWVEVLPISWLYDKEKNVFVSKYGLAAGVKRDDVNRFLSVAYQEMTQSMNRTNIITYETLND